MRGSALQRSTVSPAWGHAAGRALVAAILAWGCATQQQTGSTMKAVGTAAVVSGAIVASHARCGRSLPDERYATLAAAQDGCRPNGSHQTLGAAMAATGVGAVMLGQAIENDANRREAWDRSRAASTALGPSAQSTLPSPQFLALPEPPFSPRKPAPAGDQKETHENSGDTHGSIETGSSQTGAPDEAPAE